MFRVTITLAHGSGPSADSTDKTVIQLFVEKTVAPFLKAVKASPTVSNRTGDATTIGAAARYF